MKPNILILSRAFRAGDAITSLNLFSQWPKENLYCASLSDSEYRGEFADFYCLGDKEVHYTFPFNHFSHPRPSGTNRHQLEFNSVNSSSSYKKRIYDRWVRPTLQWLDLYENRLNISLSQEFTNWIKKIQPKVIYTSIGDLAMAKFILKIHERFPNIKLIVHGFDDWLSPTYKIWNDTFHRRKADLIFRQILSIAVDRYTSSNKMAEDYQKKYGFEFTCFPNSVEILKDNNPIQKHETPNIVFTGKIGWHNAAAIKEMINIVDIMNKEDKILHFDIFSQTPKSQLDIFLGDIPNSTILHPPVSNKDIPSILAAAHILYLPISIDHQTAKFTRYSMSTKMGEYLSSGVPVIYMGPAGIAMTEFLKDKSCAYVITENNRSILKDYIFNCLLNKNEKMLKKGKQVAEENFSKETISRSFAQRLKEIISL